jgi:hypothetical protein
VPVDAANPETWATGEAVFTQRRTTDAATGKTMWTDEHPTSFTPQTGSGTGPLCVPVVQNGRVFTFGAQGVLTGIEADGGKQLWQRDTHADFGAQAGYFGAGSSPIVVGDLVIVNVGGGQKEAGIVAFSLADGRTVWKQTSEPAGYSSPVVVVVGGEPHVLMVTRYACLLLEPGRRSADPRFGSFVNDRALGFIGCAAGPLRRCGIGGNGCARASDRRTTLSAPRVTLRCRDRA